MTRLEVSNRPVSEAVRWRSLHASGEKVGSEYEAMHLQLTANLVDAKLVHVEENLRERDENLRDLHSFFTRDTLFIRHTVDCANARAWVTLVSAFACRPFHRRRSHA